MSCDTSRIVEFINGLLPPGEMESMMVHMEECQECKSAFQDLVGIKSLLTANETGIDPSALLLPQSSSPSPWRRLRWMMVSACLLVMLFVGGLFVMKSYLIESSGTSILARLEKSRFPYVSPVTRDQGVSVDLDRESLIAFYTSGNDVVFVTRAQQWLRVHPDDTQVIFFQGVSYYLIKRYDEAVKSLSLCVHRERPPTPETLWYLANAYIQIGRVNAAVPLLRELSQMPHPYASKAEELLRALKFKP